MKFVRCHKKGERAPFLSDHVETADGRIIWDRGRAHGCEGIRDKDKEKARQRERVRGGRPRVRGSGGEGRGEGGGAVNGKIGRRGGHVGGGAHVGGHARNRGAGGRGRSQGRGHPEEREERRPNGEQDDSDDEEDHTNENSSETTSNGEAPPIRADGNFNPRHQFRIPSVNSDSRSELSEQRSTRGEQFHGVPEGWNPNAAAQRAPPWMIMSPFNLGHQYGSRGHLLSQPSYSVPSPITTEKELNRISHRLSELSFRPNPQAGARRRRDEFYR